MATTGLYKICGDSFYNHYDNYPAGAAFYFKYLLDKPRDLKAAFVNGVLAIQAYEPEPILNPADYSTNYKYELEDDLSLKVWEEAEGEDQLFYEGSLQGFIEQYEDKRITPRC